MSQERPVAGPPEASSSRAAPSGIGLALSGGGHRAALFSLGAMMYMADSGVNKAVGSIASVSGGSMANGAVAQQGDFTALDGNAFHDGMAPFAHQLAAKGTFQGKPIGRRKWWLVVPVLLLGVFACTRYSVMWRYCAYMILVGLWAIAFAWPLFATGLGRFYGAVLTTTLVAALLSSWVIQFPTGTPFAWLDELFERLATPVGRFLLFVVSIILWGWVVALRGRVCARAFESTLFSPGGKTTLLREIAPRIDHVFCSTDLQSGDQVYFGRDFIYGYLFGKGSPADLPLYEAVQASANLPFAFPAKRIATRGHHFSYLDPTDKCPAPDQRPDPYPPRAMVLSDGGVYDNMADQWAQGFAGRAEKCWPDLRVTHNEPKTLVVVNASAGMAWRTLNRNRIPLFGEVAALLQIKDVLYDQTTAQRRFGLVARFAQAELEGRGLNGVLVNIPQTPYTVADAFVRPDGEHWRDRAPRAAAVIALFGDDDPTRATWKARAERATSVPTVLSAIGEDDSVNLLRHGYNLAMANGHVILDYPLARTLPPDERFIAMARGEPYTGSWSFEPAAGRPPAA